MGAPAARAAELARHWTEDGHEVTVLTGFPNHPTGVVPPEYRQKMRRLVCSEDLNGIRVVRSWLWPLPNRKAHERVLNYSSFCLSAVGTGMCLPRPDVVIATSPQLLVGLAGYWIARIKRTPFVFEVRDLWPESLVAVGMGHKDSVMNRSLGAIAGFLYRRANHIVVVTPAFREHLVERWRVQAEKISVVENGVETELFSPAANGTQVREEMRLQDKFVVGYIGTLGMAHGLETLIEAAAETQRVAPGVSFLVVGEGAEKARLAALAETKHLGNVLFVDQQERAKIPEFIRACDVCLVLLRKSDLFKTVIPTKMLEFMSCGRPVVLGVEGQARHIIEQARAGICIEPQNAAELVTAILRLRDSSVLREQFGRNGRNHIRAHYSRRQTAKTYISVLEDICSPQAVLEEQPSVEVA